MNELQNDGKLLIAPISAHTLSIPPPGAVENYLCRQLKVRVT